MTPSFASLDDQEEICSGWFQLVDNIILKYRNWPCCKKCRSKWLYVKYEACQPLQ